MRTATLEKSEAVHETHDPDLQVAQNNPWYTASQFQAHFSHPSYRAVVERRLGIFETAFASYLEQHQAARTVRMLDAGCGDGINLVGVRQIIGRRGWDIRQIGIDYNTLRAQRAKSENVGAVAAGSICELPISSEQIDVVLCSQVLEHIPDDGGALLEINRVLQPNGILILAIPNEGCLFARIRNRVLQPSIHRKTDHVNFYTSRRARILAESAGFDVLNVHREGLFLPNMRIHNALGSRKLGRAATNAIAGVIPSQSAGLILVCRKSGS